ncbi:flagellar hook-associated protein FlgK [Bisbaumannia pacifica]|uniref:Flagellar hook-associated protein 1 n=1 Tax=Bisbaumannia pacifica TaxID=77098 RepID=A0ABD4L2V2_9GAMM|nr:flagellar hook-associated protein FlgK [Halomonas pacifica]MBH8579894.1 flagellar hook-associated protein FlgK [Halomonas pacifica]
MSLFSIGVSGLNAAQNALATTGNNINNVYTPGYNRELTILSEGRGGSGGVQVQDIQRQFNQYVAGQLNAATSKSSALNTYQSQISQIDSLLADRDAGLAPLMQDFFSSLEDLAGAPSDPAARQGVIGSANTLSAQFRSFDDYLADMQDGVNGLIRDEIAQINNATEELAYLNREIALARARSGEAPNSLLNQRDHLVHEMSERLDLRLNIQDGKSYNVSLPNGQPLVAGTQAFKLEAVNDASDPERTIIGYRDPADNLTKLEEDVIQGGTLGGIMTFRSESLDRVQNQLGQMAVSLAEAFNVQHRQGIDLNGDAGGDMFGLGQSQAFSHENNGGTASLDVAFGTYNDPVGGPSDLTNLAATGYDVVFDGSDYVVTRQDTGATLDPADVDLSGGVLSFGGLEITIQNGPPVAGDRFNVQPLKGAAGGMDNLIGDTSKIAAGEEDLSGDNRNALAMQELQDKQVVGGSATLSQAYGALVSDVGNRTNIVKVNAEAQQGLTDQLSAVQQSESGVNLDEEAANLMRYQQFYMANAKVIETGTTIIDTLLNLRS